MKYNFPIKYGVMPVYELDEKKNVTIVAYIPSKCYVISEKTKYSKDGKQTKEYETVFPYQESEVIKDLWHRTFPHFVCDDCINTFNTDHVFAKYEEAENKANELNHEIFKSKLQKLSLTDNYNEAVESLKENHNNTLRRLNDIACKIEINTKELIPNNTPKNQDIVISYNKDTEYLPISIYEFLRKYKYLKFRVYNITEDKLNELKNQLSNTKRIIISGIDFNDYLLDNNGHITKIANIDPKIIQGSLYLNEKNNIRTSYENLNELADANFQGIKVFTTETYEDIIASFKSHEDIKYIEEEVKLTRTK